MNGERQASRAFMPSGDVAGPPGLLTKRAMRGTSVSRKSPDDLASIPSTSTGYQDVPIVIPRLRAIGLTETAAREQGYNINVGTFPFVGNGKAIALGEPEGMVKTVFDSQDR